MSVSHHFHLNRSFDIQLCPVAASIIDWIPTRRAGSSYAEASTIPQRDILSPSATDVPNFPSGTTRSDSALPEAAMQHRAPVGRSFVGKSAALGVPFQIVRRQFLADSCATVHLFSRDSLEVSAGLLAGLGFVAGPPGHDDASPDGIPLTKCPLFFHANDVLQLGAIWGRRQWASVLNVLCFSWSSRGLPMCEFIAVTPRTDFSLQADRLLFNCSGFWRVFVRGGRSRRDSLISMKTPVERASAHSPVHFGRKIGATATSVADMSNRCYLTAARANDNDVVLEGASGGEHLMREYKSTGTSTASPGGIGASHVENREADVKLVKVESRGKNLGTTIVEPSAEQVAHHHSEHSCATIRRHRWWHLEELRCGVGVAVKNDLVSGVNVYCGCSGHLGRALTFSTHIDVLRRSCYSVTCNTDSVDLAMRLRTNLITSHFTEIDSGIAWRPFKLTPGFTCRLSYSVGRVYMGMTIENIVGQWDNFVSSGRKEVSEFVGRDPALTPEAPSVEPPPEQWYTPYLNRIVLTGSSAFGTVWAGNAASASLDRPTVEEKLSSPGLGARISRAVQVGLGYMGAVFHGAKFDLTVGLATQRSHQPRSLKLFVAFSAH
ncbi:hypothetical protein ERJ75_001225900 [Trypanosoma vivax]|uniref:Uncharacterized protein n=1 Tax=Trypanosoma vivax (strain Y486) TaxID=1055687 RepID=G0U1A7_TRYVY|nr:hypothetical protein TRVL_01583 [Trypanosoma vivax]KAH8608953.1 hypothetical protein ERJ75_001225900 [Trypanosoma vivax]CCC49862.1 conserved hypothetical protein [Trypanosoma vivax Y486]